LPTAGGFLTSRGPKITSVPAERLTQTKTRASIFIECALDFLWNAMRVPLAFERDSGREMSLKPMPQQILVIDDEAPIRDLLTDFFRKHGFGIRTAALADEGLLLAEQQRPDLIVLDIALAETDGMELLVSLKSTYPAIPIIILTGMGMDDDILREVQARGAAGCVSKTDPLDILLTEALRAMNRNLK
jgi:CheY-like chemotaxis protein